jgi:CRP/FNR family transcriptional regulator, cyclic AMP receptor protein
MAIKSLFTNSSELRDLAAGDVVFREGEVGELMFGVVSGEIALQKDGREIVRVGPEGTFGELALIDTSPRSLTAVALVPSEVAVIDKRTFLFLVHETPMFAIQVMTAMAARIRELDNRG